MNYLKVGIPLALTALCGCMGAGSVSRDGKEVYRISGTPGIHAEQLINKENKTEHRAIMVGQDAGAYRTFFQQLFETHEKQCPEKKEEKKQ